MVKAAFDQLLASGVLTGDGAPGIELHRRGLPPDACPELWALSHADAVQQVTREYAAAGACHVTTPTLGGNPLKLARYGLEDRTEELNAACVRLTREAAGGCLVAASLGPTEETFTPMGRATLEELVSIYKRQVSGLLRGGPDFFLLETFQDAAEARAAVLAVKELCDLPFAVCMTFDGGHAATGAAPEATAVIFSALGASAVGCSCPGGPESLIEAVSAMARHTRIPVIARLNAGMPVMPGGETPCPLDPEPFARQAAKLVDAGATLVGGCCGTTPAHIRALSAQLHGCAPAPRETASGLLLAGQRAVAFIRLGGPLCVVGERINPSGKPGLTQELRALRTDTALALANAQQAAGAHALDVNAGAGGVDEAEALCLLAEELPQACQLPLSLDSADPLAMAAAVRLHAGRPLMNSVSITPLADALLETAAFYGAAPVLLPLEHRRMPETAAGRRAVIEKLLEKASRFGFGKGSVLVDCGTPSAAVPGNDPMEALEFVRQMRAEGCLTVAGISNISYGLPGRTSLNRAWLAALMSAGLSAAILNPERGTMDTVAAGNLLRGDDPHSKAYIGRHRSR